MEDNMKDWDYLQLQKLNVFNVSSYYINYGRDFATRRMSAMLFSELAAEAGHLSGEQRAQLYGPEGFVNTGFPVEGPAPIYGSWPTGKALSAEERARLHTATGQLQQRLDKINGAGRMHEGPYAFETEQTMAKCFAHIRALMKGPLASELEKEDTPSGTWVLPFFGLGQKWNETTKSRQKVRPIANEKKRNNLCSPLSEHLALPGTDTVVDMSFACLNPDYLDSVNETRDDVIRSLERGRQKAALSKGAHLQWLNVEAMPKAQSGYKGFSFVPTCGKLDMFQACLQLAVKDPSRNLFQVFDPETETFRCGMLNVLSFGNVHSVFGFCAGISELVNSVVNEILEIPCAVYVDDLIFLGAQGLAPIYMKAIRRLLAAMGIAVAPEKCFTAEHGEKIDLLGIDFLPEQEQILVALPEKKVLKKYGWKLPEQIKANPLAAQRGKISNHYNGTKKKLEYWVKHDETKSKRPRAQNVVPRFFSSQWPMSDAQTLFLFPEEAPSMMSEGGLGSRNSKWRAWLYYTLHHLPQAYWRPQDIDSHQKYTLLRENHPNALWAQLQIFGMFLFDREIQCPEVYASTVSQRLRSLGCLERGNSQAAQLQSLTFDNLNRYSQLFEPTRALPPDLSLLHTLTVDEQRIFGMWSCTGLRKISFASIRPDCIQESNDKRFMKALIPCIKSIPVPGECFFAYLPKSVFFPQVLPVTTTQLDAIAHKLHTTSHGVRRALALYLRRRCAEIGLFPNENGTHSQECLVFKQKVSDLLGWAAGSTMWEESYSEDICFHLSAMLAIHPDVDRYFTDQPLSMVVQHVGKN
eukprot:g13640.t1